MSPENEKDAIENSRWRAISFTIKKLFQNSSKNDTIDNLEVVRTSLETEHLNHICLSNNGNALLQTGMR